MLILYHTCVEEYSVFMHDSLRQGVCFLKKKHLYIKCWLKCLHMNSSPANIVGSIRGLKWMNSLFISRYKFLGAHNGSLVIFHFSYFKAPVLFFFSGRNSRRLVESGTGKI